jgi:hypothetical protein
MSKYNYEVPKEDNWFRYVGQKPPERIPHLTDEDREDLMKHNLDGHECQWYQNGAFAVCDQAEFEHGMKIPNGMLLDKEQTDKIGKPTYRKYGAILRK